MSPKTDTWMAFYVGDYVADTLHLAREHHGSYLLLILAAFRNDGWLPNDDILLAQIAKCTCKQWRAERHVYARFFVVDDERWVHNRVTRELKRSNEITAKRQRAGITSAAKRQQMANTCSTHVGDVLQQKDNTCSTHVVDVLQQTGIPSQSQSHIPLAKANGRSPPDISRIIFGECLAWLVTASGQNEQACRSLLGKWRKQSSDEALVTALGRCQREGAIEPIGWMEKAIKAHMATADPRPGWN